MVGFRNRTDVALIGFGAIARLVLGHLSRRGSLARVRWVLVRPHRAEAVEDVVPRDVKVISAIDQLGNPGPAIAVECAGHGAVRDYGEAVLAKGIDLVVISVGALADGDLRIKLLAAAGGSGARLILPAGAIAGADALAAARIGGLERVIYTARKPPGAWKGTPGERICNLDSLTDPAVLYQGGAAEAARLYPQNANVAATIALAGLGFEATRVELIADPAVDGNVHHIEAEGGFGSLSITLRGKPLPDNPKTSTLAALSVLRAIENRAGAVAI